LGVGELRICSERLSMMGTLSSGGWRKTKNLRWR